MSLEVALALFGVGVVCAWLGASYVRRTVRNDLWEAINGVWQGLVEAADPYTLEELVEFRRIEVGEPRCPAAIPDLREAHSALARAIEGTQDTPRWALDEQEQITREIRHRRGR